MTNPCLDEYFVTFDTLDAMMYYHDDLTRETQWLLQPRKKFLTTTARKRIISYN